MRNEYSYRENESDINNYILMYNNNVAQINNLYSMNCMLQNNINLIRNTQYRPRARRHARNTAPPPSLSVPTHAPNHAPSSVYNPTPNNLNNMPGLATTRSRNRTNAFGLPLPSTSTTRQDSTENENPNTNANTNARTRTRRQPFFDPVIIYPTQTQIENATRFVQYDTIINPSNESCPFTYEPFTNQDMVRQILFCGHICSSVGFNTWFNSNVSCPICRYDIRNYRPTSMFNNEDLVSSFPAPTTDAQARPEAPSNSESESQTRTPSAFSQLMDIDDDTTDFMIRNYLGFWYDVASTAATSRAETPSPVRTTSTETTPSARNNILYYTIRNLERNLDR